MSGTENHTVPIGSHEVVTCRIELGAGHMHARASVGELRMNLNSDSEVNTPCRSPACVLTALRCSSQKVTDSRFNGTEFGSSRQPGTAPGARDRERQNTAGRLRPCVLPGPPLPGTLHFKLLDLLLDFTMLLVLIQDTPALGLAYHKKYMTLYCPPWW